jgi:hypothetical protein
MLKRAAMIGRPVASTTPIVQPAAVAGNGKTDTAVPKEQTIEAIAEPPQEIRGSNKAVKNYYKNVLGHLPANWKSFPRIAYKKSIKVGGPTSESKTLKDFKDLKDNVKPKYPADTGTQVTDGALPILPPKVIEAIQADFKDLDKSSKEIPDPETLLADMKKFPTFWEQLGIEKKITDAWDDDDLKDLCTKYSAWAWVLIKNYRDLQLLADATTPVVEGQPEVEEERVDTSGTGVVKPEPAAAPAATVENKPRPKFQTLKRKNRAAM